MEQIATHYLKEKVNAYVAQNGFYLSTARLQQYAQWLSSTCKTEIDYASAAQIVEQLGFSPVHRGFVLKENSRFITYNFLKTDNSFLTTLDERVKFCMSGTTRPPRASLLFNTVEDRILAEDFFKEKKIEYKTGK